ncbi:unnamed protein product [Periconia digitata]|uniref:O-methyltransferase C-terminal domain-containing protein n=1 Tax=Periconia digitata TaxID=1303443 RepID=A0A9W4XX72_9PLEO|nr:unnamed protein product [Periconia digitata]
MPFDVYFLRDDYSSIMTAKRQDLLRLLAAAQATASELQDDLAQDPLFRLAATEASSHLTRTLQTTIDRAWELFLRPAHPTTLLVTLDAGWIQYINANYEDGTKSGIMADQLAQHTSSDPELVKRLMRVLTANGTIREVGINEYAPTPFSKLFDNQSWADGLRHAVRDYSITMSGMPDYFAKSQYQLENTGKKIYQHVHGTTFFDRVHAGGEVGSQFNSFMRVVRDGKKSWFDVYPIGERLQPISKKEVLLVDVGGGRGHDLYQFSRWQKDQQFKGRLVLQDAPTVIAQVRPEQSVDMEVQEYDFFTPQKMLGARAYFLKNVLHDWPNDKCIDILIQVRDAMKPGYSRLLINEIVLPDEKCDSWTAAYDIAMMAVVDGKERSREQWGDLIDAAGGLKIEKIWRLGLNNESIIEVARA